MRVFRLSPAMQTYFNALTNLTVPSVAPAPVGSEETAFYTTVMVPLAQAIASMAAAVAVTQPTPQVTGTIGEVAAAAEAGVPGAQAVYEEMLWQQASAGAP